MLLTITTTAQPATDLGFLLHKHPARVQDVELSFGKAHVFYPEASAERCTAALLLEVDPVGLVRGRGDGDGALDAYVNDRPYVASSFMSVAIARVFGTALAGRCENRPDLVDRPLPFVARLAVVPCRGGEGLLRRLFEPLGYEVRAEHHPLDTAFTSWGEGPYFTVELRTERTLADLLTHLYVLIPVLDDDKHYFVGQDELEKLLRQGEGWLATHPEKDLITRRYLKHFKNLTREALARLVQDEGVDPDLAEATHAAEEADVERRISLAEERVGTVLAVLKSESARSVLDLGCGEGRFLRALLADAAFEKIVGIDVSHRALERASERLRLEDLPARRRERISLLHGALTYRDKRLAGFDAAVIIEVIEHLDPPRLRAFERVVFECARPTTVVITTPNVEYNVHFPGLPAGRFRHRDHRFEWTRTEFEAWAAEQAARFGYAVRFLPVGPNAPETGPPTQMGVFRRG
jgi:3' terminal RNA ribose 2'-O-methyltransferase Hen1